MLKSIQGYVGGCRLCGKTIAHNIVNQRFLAVSAAAAVSQPQIEDVKRPKDIKLEDIRNIGISAHIDSGKTTVTERLLYYTGRIDSIHEVKGKDGVGAKMDSMELERQRGITIKSAATYFTWGKHAVNVIDTPGHVDFTIEVERSLRVLDGAVLVLCGVAGVQSQTMTVNRQMARYKVPAVAFINKLDRMNASPDRVNTMLQQRLMHNTGFITYPIGIEKALKGVINVVDDYAIYFDGDNGEILRHDEIPQDLRAKAKDLKSQLVESLTNVDDEIADIYLDEKTPTDDQIKEAIRRCCIKRTFTPILCGSALKNVGVQPLLDAACDYLPNPSEVDNFAYDNTDVESSETKKEPVRVKMEPVRSKEHPMISLAFKLEANRFGQLTFFRIYQGSLTKGEMFYNTRTGKKVRISNLARMHSNEMEQVDQVFAGDIFTIPGLDCSSGDTFVTNPEMMDFSMENIFVPKPVVSMSITPKNQKQTDNFSKAINRFQKEDPTFVCYRDSENGETIASGMGELHLDIYAQRMEREYGCPVVMGQPMVKFRETIRDRVPFDYLHKKQSGGHGQYGRIQGYYEPLVGDNFLDVEFLDKVKGTAISKNYMKGIERGFRDACEEGSYTGSKITGIRMVLEDGVEHPVDSGEKAFYNCSFLCMKQFYDICERQVIEPVMAVEASTPYDFSSECQSSLVVRGGRVTNVEGSAEVSYVSAEVPLSNMFGYISELRSLTEGKGDFTMEFKCYRPVEYETEQQLITDWDTSGRVYKKKFHTD